MADRFSQLEFILANLSKLAQLFEDLREAELEVIDTVVESQRRKLDTLATELQSLRAYKERFPKETEYLEQIWARLRREPYDPARTIESYFRPQREKNLRAFQEWLKNGFELFNNHRSLILGWKKLLQEYSRRVYLANLMEKKLGELKESVAQYRQELEREARVNPPALEDTSPTVPDLDSVESDGEVIVKELQLDSEKPIETEKRRYPRLDLGTVVQFHSSTGASFYTGFTENISSGGLFISTYEFLPELGDRFTVEFSLPNGRKIEAEVEVAWIREFSPLNPEISPGFGCKFLRLSPEDEAAINEYISKEGSLFMLDPKELELSKEQK